MAEKSRLRAREWRIGSSSPGATENPSCRGFDAFEVCRGSNSLSWLGAEVRRMECQLRFHPHHLTEIQNEIVHR
ncbi:hypothetical protein TNCV_4424261 [Trichonephila clavipes]|nr:hypothetical protein TNCV_4424261 [Trichonephila clavipes]